VDRNVAASTQNQALSALLFLYREVLRKDVGSVDAVRAKKPKRMVPHIPPKGMQMVRYAGFYARNVKRKIAPTVHAALEALCLQFPLFDLEPLARTFQHLTISTSIPDAHTGFHIRLTTSGNPREALPCSYHPKFGLSTVVRCLSKPSGRVPEDLILRETAAAEETLGVCRLTYNFLDIQNCRSILHSKDCEASGTEAGKRHLDVDVDAVQQRPEGVPLVAADRRHAARALVHRVAVVAAGTGVHRGDEHILLWEVT
jgi:hypothetical protein